MWILQEVLEESKVSSFFLDLLKFSYFKKTFKTNVYDLVRKFQIKNMLTSSNGSELRLAELVPQRDDNAGYA